MKQPQKSEIEKVRVFDTTLRDGEQSAGVCFSREAKLEIAEQLDTMCVDVIEAGFPTASEGEFRAVEAVARRVRNGSVAALARAVPAEVERTADALADAVSPTVHVVLSSSEIHMAHQLRRSREEVVEMAVAAVRAARNRAEWVEFSLMDATRSDITFVATLARAAVAAGATTINVPDTVGIARPEQISTLFEELFSRVPELENRIVSFHGQDDLGLATANSLAAIAAGVRQVEVAVNGIGERAGNTSFEEIVMALRVHGAAMGVYTDVDPGGIYGISRVVSALSGMEVAPNKAVVGRNAFRHASGLHQDGIVKSRETYECLDPREIGHPFGTEIVLGKLSGRAGFAARLHDLGVALGPREMDAAFARFQTIADAGEVVDDAVLARICGRATRGVEPPRARLEAWPGPGV